MKVFHEITPVTSSDVFVILDSIDKGFDYPIHNHAEYELNLILGSSGQRIVGDSTQTYQNQDMVLIGPYLFHKWDDEDKNHKDSVPCRVITIQFDMHLFDGPLLNKKPFASIKNMLQNASRGIRFTGHTFKQAKEIAINLTQLTGMESVIQFLLLLEILSNSRSYQYLASVGFDHTIFQATSKRLHAAYQYILRNFKNTGLRMSEISTHVNLSDSAFSHFFKKYTNRSFSDFLIDMRLGYSCKLLLETDDLIADICFNSGFNNLANFNRLFKKKHLCSPKVFRKNYQVKNSFDWTKQISPGQFLPSDLSKNMGSQPAFYSTKLMHH